MSPRRCVPRLGLSEGLAVCFAGFATAVVAAPSLAYPFGRDQGVFFYVAREWLRRGALPYRDTFDHKPPGIHVVHALAIALFGEHIWSIRILEIPVIIAIGAVAAYLARPAPDRRWAVYALSILGVSTLYFGHMAFWDTAQPELWAALFALGALAVCQRGDSGQAGPARVAAAGALLSLAVLMKPSAVPLAAVVGWIVGRRRPVPLVAGAAAPAALVAAYFGAHGALGTLLDVVLSANLVYVRNENVGGVTDAVTRILDVARQLLPTSFVLAYGSLYLHRRAARAGDQRARAEYGAVLVMAVAAFVGVVVQLKFYTYHFILMLAPAAFAFALLVRDALEWLRVRGWPHVRAMNVVMAHILGLFALSYAGEHLWFASARDGLLLATGRLPERRYLERFRIASLHFDAAANSDVAHWLREHAKPGDSLCDRSFEPEIYAETGMRCDDRFFWTSWISYPNRKYHRDDWVAEDLSALQQSPPRFITVKVDEPERVNQAAYFVSLGYVQRAQISGFVVLEREVAPTAQR